MAFSANMMGYVTGYGKNFGYVEEPYSQNVWGEVPMQPEEETD